MSSVLSGTIATICNADDKQFVNQTAVLVQEANNYPNNINTRFHISGTIRVVDGCTFSVENFVFLPGYDDTLWYMRKNGDSNAAMIASYDLVSGSNGDTMTWKFTNVPGAEMSWYDLDTLVLFSRKEKFEMASAKFYFPNRPLFPSFPASTTTSAAATAHSTAAAAHAATSTNSTTSATSSSRSRHYNPPSSFVIVIMLLVTCVLF
jgi:hypothetical protein